MFAIYDNLLDILDDVGLMDVEAVAKNFEREILWNLRAGLKKNQNGTKNMDVENEITSHMEDALWKVEDEYHVLIKW